MSSSRSCLAPGECVPLAWADRAAPPTPFQLGHRLASAPDEATAGASVRPVDHSEVQTASSWPDCAHSAAKAQACNVVRKVPGTIGPSQCFSSVSDARHWPSQWHTFCRCKPCFAEDACSIGSHYVGLRRSENSRTLTASAIVGAACIIPPLPWRWLIRTSSVGPFL